MTTSPSLFGLARGSSDIRENPIFGFDAFGLKACNTALADARLLPSYQLRRAHLLQAKALHQIGAGQAEQALAALTESDAIVATLQGRYFSDSVGLGNRAVRGFALISLGRKADRGGSPRRPVGRANGDATADAARQQPRRTSGGAQAAGGSRPGGATKLFPRRPDQRQAR
jgi:hypothetical protein